MVKQNFEIANARSFYKQEVSMLQSEIGEIKKDFSQNLADVKSSMVQCSHDGDTSLPQIDIMQSSSIDEEGSFPHLITNDDDKINSSRLSKLGSNQ